MSDSFPLCADIVNTAKLKVEHIAGKGYGLVATENLRAGTRILIESPLLKNSTGNVEGAKHAWRFVPKAQKVRFLKLCGTCLPKDKMAEAESCFGKSWDEVDPTLQKVLEIEASNVWSTTSSATVILNLGSRFNHSCFPNVQAAWVESKQALVATSMRDVSKGEELTICYIKGVFRDTSARQAELARDWGFECSCTICILSTPIAEKHHLARLRIALLFDKIAEPRDYDGTGFQDAFGELYYFLSQIRIELEDIECYDSDYVTICEILIACSLRMQDDKNAVRSRTLEYVDKALKIWDYISGGHEHKELEELRERLSKKRKKLGTYMDGFDEGVANGWIVQSP